jgi:hypothetical protein
MHEHGCQHELVHCPVCDVVYCKKCGKEWGQHQHWYTYPTIWCPNITAVSPSITWTNNTGGNY